MTKYARNPHINEAKSIVGKGTRLKGILLSLMDLTKGPFTKELLILEWFLRIWR